MPALGVKRCGQATSKKAVLKKASNDSGVGSTTSSAAWSTRETRLSASAASTVGALALVIKPEQTAAEPSSPHSIPQLAPPTMFGNIPPLNPNADQSHRKSRRVESWLQEQQRLSTSIIDEAAKERIAKASGTPCNPYLAYPGMSKYPSWQSCDDDDDFLGSFVIVEEEESEREPRISPSMSGNASKFEPPRNDLLSVSTPFYEPSTRPSSLSAPRPASILSVSSWRNLPFTKTLPAPRYVSAPGEPIDLSTPPASINIGSINRRSPIPEDFLKIDPSTDQTFGKIAHNKASSTTLRGPGPETPRTSMRKRLGSFMRYHGNASSSSNSPTSTKDSSSPRPSTSASATTATTSTAVESDLHSSGAGNHNYSLPKFNINLLKASRQQQDYLQADSPSRSSFSSQHEELCNESPPPTHTVSHPDLFHMPALTKKRSQPSIFRDKQYNASSSALSTLSIGSIGSMATNINERASNVFTGSSTMKRKRLVVSGIEWDNTAAMDGLRRWCERFGELRQITRMPNGDLHIDFKRADVADTVCRISARVHITDVGSVNMSWISGKRH